MQKSDIKNGMHVITNSGREYLIISNVEANEQTFLANTIMVRLDGEGWLPLDKYNDDLCYRFNDNDDDAYYDIKEVYVSNFYVNILSSVHDAKNSFTKVWERPITRKMTKAEIEAELGYKIEIID
jgi:hypothetical protein